MDPVQSHAAERGDTPALVLGDRTVTPEMSTKFSVKSEDPNDWRLTWMTAPPPSRRYGAVPASDGAALAAGSMTTLSAPAPLIVSGLLMVKPFFDPACAGLLLADVALDTSR